MAEHADRKLVLLRHAKSAWNDVPDHERPLAQRGRRDAPAMGRWLRAANHVPDQVLCSSARRARETWQLSKAGLGSEPPVHFDNRVYQASAAQLLELLSEATWPAKALLIVGHDPGIPELAVMLAETARAAGGDAQRPEQLVAAGVPRQRPARHDDDRQVPDRDIQLPEHRLSFR